MEWAEQALCRDGDPDAMFPDRQADEHQAAKTCRRCPVAAECLRYALQHGMDHGVWGGLTARERRIVAHRSGQARTRSLSNRAPAYVRGAAARGVPLRELATSMRAQQTR